MFTLTTTRSQILQHQHLNNQFFPFLLEVAVEFKPTTIVHLRNLPIVIPNFDNNQNGINNDFGTMVEQTFLSKEDQ